MCKTQKGQTLIETALILILLLLILLGISEFARAWYMKNSLKNAVRHGARLAVVASGITLTQRDLNDPTCPNSGYTSCAGNACPADPSVNAAIIDAVCCSPGVQNRNINDPDGGTEVILTYTDNNPGGTLNSNDTVAVCARTSFKTIVHSFSPWIRDIDITTDASMRYE